MTDDFKKRLKEIADKVSDSQSAQSVTTTQTPKTSTSISTNTKTTNKSGRMKSAPIIKEPKREKLSWSDEDSRDGWNDRLFLEGFYEVDSTVNDWEREKRMSQVERSLKEIEKRKRKAENPPGVILSGGQRPNLNAVRAPFRRKYHRDILTETYRKRATIRRINQYTERIRIKRLMQSAIF